MGTMRGGTVRSRRARLGTLGVLAMVLPLLLAACGDVAPTVAPTRASTSTAALAPTAEAAVGATAVTVTTGSTGSTATTTTGSAPATTAPASVAPAPSVPRATTGAASTTSATSATGTTAGGPDPRGQAPAKRGGGGTLRLLWWQAPTILNAHLAVGNNNKDAARLVTEPLATTSLNAATPDIPVLAREIPDARNGLLAADGLSVTWRLKDGVRWSDGTPFTATDVRATWQYIARKESGANTFGQYENIADVETPDATTARIVFKSATALWFTPFTNFDGAVLQKAQLDGCRDRQNCAANANPIGTGPYKVRAFMPGDNVQYALNEQYREVTAPYFDAVDLKGGGDPTTAAKAVQTGQADYAWNLQVTPEILKQLTDAGGAIDLAGGGNGGVEQLFLNFTDPNREVDGERSSVKAPHLFLTDIKVREAISYLLDREGIARNLYGPTGKPWCNVTLGTASKQLQSATTQCGFDVARANRLLDEAGYVRGADGVRAKGSVRLSIVFGTTVNAVREREQQVIRQAFTMTGIETVIKNADAGVFFGSSNNPDQRLRFEKDVQMWTYGPVGPDARDFFEGFTCKQIPQKANGWSLNNEGRWCNPEYDRLFETLDRERNPERRAAIQVQLNDFVVSQYVRLPMIDRSQAHGRQANLGNTNPLPWDSVLWNIAYWQRT